MMNNKNPKIIVTGYPMTGKTTFLAALWYVINNTDELNSGLRLYKLTGNNVYLNSIQNKWLGNEEVDRTKLNQEKKISFELEDLQSGNVFGLSFPDLSGERFRQQFEDRQCSAEFADMVKESTGCLLFIHCNSIKKALPIIKTEQIIQPMRKVVSNHSQKKEEEKSEDVKPWDITMPCMQVKAIELLQFISYLRDLEEPIRLALVFSAWDLVKNHNITPDNFLKIYTPFLNQFLLANTRLFQYKVFGVSATGIEIGKDNLKNVSAYANKIIKPTDRIIVQSSNDNRSSHDLTDLLKWVL